MRYDVHYIYNIRRVLYCRFPLIETQLSRILDIGWFQNSHILNSVEFNCLFFYEGLKQNLLANQLNINIADLVEIVRLHVNIGKLFATQALSQTQKNVSEPQTGIEPATFWSPVRRSNHCATRTQMAERRPRCVPVRIATCDTRTAGTAVSICQYILIINEYIYMKMTCSLVN